MFYSYAVDTITKLDSLKNSFSKKQPKLLTSELLFNYLVTEIQQFSILTTDITCTKTNLIESELNNSNYDSVITFNRLDRKDFKLTETDSLSTNFLCNETNDQQHLPIFINSDTSCPLRKLTLELTNDHKRLIEIDSLENILQLILNGDGIALLPCYLEKKGYSTTDSKIFNIEYYYYRHII